MNYLITVLQITFLLIALIFLAFDFIYVKEVNRAKEHMEINLPNAGKQLLRLNAVISAIGVIIVFLLIFVG
ncbi:MAG: hypothetical protein V1697_00110 [Candidatus Levyibacteriota bacterium]